MGDLFLARADGSPQRFYSLSARTWRDRTGLKALNGYAAVPALEALFGIGLHCVHDASGALAVLPHRRQGEAVAA